MAKEKKLTNKEMTASLMQLGGHIRNLDYLLMHFVEFSGKSVEFKKYIIDKQAEAKKEMADAEQKSKDEEARKEKEKSTD